MLGQRGVRVLAVGVLLLSAGIVFWGATTGSATTPLADRQVPPRENVTVVATDSNAWLGRSGSGPRATAELVAFGPDGSTIYYNDSHTRYWDVDPVPGTRMTVEYVAADHLSASACGQGGACTRNVVERVNLTTGTVTRVYDRVTPGKHSTRWHDVDRLNDTHLVVADIARDRVYIVNTTTGLTTWGWDARSDYRPTESGGPYPTDWTHLNDVEVLPDGRIMASLRNQDQVVFLHPQTGLQENWTLGGEDQWETLYEQHNPDYIPPERGGPAVIVADSENNRLVEYQRVDGGWERSWRWSDAQLQWPRDADRLPSGNTLVTDSNGDRVLEVAPNGSVVWEVDVGFPYEAERLGTGDESAGGQSAERADLTSRTATTGRQVNETAAAGPLDSMRQSAAGAFDGPLINGVIYVLPVWMGALELWATVLAALTLVLWLVAEAWWSPWSVRVAAPLRLER